MVMIEFGSPVDGRNSTIELFLTIGTVNLITQRATAFRTCYNASLFHPFQLNICNFDQEILNAKPNAIAP